MSTSASTASRRPAPKTLCTPATDHGASLGGHLAGQPLAVTRADRGRRRTTRSSSVTQLHGDQAEERGAGDRDVEALGAGGVPAGEVEDQPPQAAAHAGRDLADDRADHADGGGDAQRREEVRQRGREAQATQVLRAVGAA